MVAIRRIDPVTAIAVVGGTVAVGAGLWFLLKKPPGVSPGETIAAHFKFDYSGEGGAYVLQVYFGSSLVGGWFNHVFGFTMDVELPSPGTYEFDMMCVIPLGTKAQKYDAEALIRTPDMAEFDYLIKKVTDGAIEVRKE